MARSAVLNVQVLVDAAKSASELNQTVARFESFGKKVVGAVVATAAIKGITDLAKSVVTSASTMEQAMGGTDKVFGSSASQIHSWAADTTDAIRLPAAAVEKYAVLIKTQLAATGQPMATLVTQTKALIQVGADLAAVTGADLADSIAAVKSALAGEYDPIQNLGVAITGTTVNLKAMAIAHGDAALAASSSVQAQARVAEIMEKSAFATGAAAEESNSFQAKIDSLKEQVSALAVAIGGPMLDSLANMVGSATEATSALQTMGTGLGTMLGAVLSLPAPIQAVVLGLLALVAISAKWGAAASAGFVSFLGSVKTATTSVTGFKAALSAIGPALGGGLLIGGALVLFGLIAQMIGRVTEATKAGTSALSGYVDALVASGNKGSDASAKAFKEALLASDAYKGLTKEGFSAAEAVNILSGTQENWIKVAGNGSDASMNLTKDTFALVDGFIDANGEAGKLAQAQIDGAAAMGLNADATDGATIALDANAQATADAEAAAKNLAAAIDQAKRDAEATTGNQWLNDIASQAEDAKRAIDILQVAIDKSTGNNRDYQASQAAVNASILALPDAFKLAEGATSANADALKKWNVQALTVTEAGQSQYKAVQDIADAYTDSTGKAYQNALATHSAAEAMGIAREQAANSRAQFIGMHDAMGLTADEAAVLADKVGILDATKLDDKTFEVIAQDADARRKVAELQSLGVDPKTITFSADMNPALEGFQGTLTYMDAVTQQPKTITVGADTTAVPPAVDGAAAVADGATATINVGADPGPANSTIAGVTGAKRDTAINVGATTTIYQGAISALISDTRNRTATLQVDANVNQANSQVNAFTSAKRITTVDVMANLASAAVTIAGFVNQNRITTVTVAANTGPAQSSIASVTNGSYSATVRVYADTSAFMSAFNALPTTKTITQNVVQVPAAAPAPAGFASSFAASAAPQVLSRMAAPSTMARSLSVAPSLGPVQTQGNAGGSTTIIVQGGIESSDAIARAVKRVVLGRDRRTGGVVVGEMRSRVGHS